MKRFLIVFLNPFFLSLWATLLIMLLFPVKIDKYTATPLESGVNLNKRIVCYEDLDADGNSEEIAIFHNSLGTAGMTISNQDGVLDQWSFHGTYDFVMPGGIMVTGDSDGDGIREVYVFVLSNDSLYLNMIPDFRKPEIFPQKRFVTSIGKRGDKSDPYLLPAEMQDLNNDGLREFVFGVGTGYSQYPRRIYAWDHGSGRILQSPESSFFIKGILQEDINGDSIKEIIPYGYAASNVSGPGIAYPDTCSWLMVLDQELQFLFDPVSFSGAYSGLYPAVLHNSAGKTFLAALYASPDRLGDSNKLILFGSRGNIEKTVTVDGNTDQLLIFQDKNKAESFLLPVYGKGIELYDQNLKRKKFIPLKITGGISIADIDLDGRDEVMSTDLYKRQLTIWRNELDHPVTVTIKGEGEAGIIYSIKKQAGSNPKFFVQLGDDYLVYEYKFNAAYHYIIPVYAAIYLSILLFIFLVRKIQQNQLQLKHETARKINEMQLMLVRNQLDPHFIMNAINSIMAGITDHNQEEARNQLMHFSRLHRSLLLSSTQIHRTIQEEITFTGDYLALEKLRFHDRFDYSITIDPKVDTSIKVPKMILQIHVENALKHGIMPLSRKGRLTVNISAASGKLAFEITDNGVGREFARNHHEKSTGKGLQVMEQYIELYNSQHKDQIQSKIQDLFDDQGNPVGTKIIIDISIAHEKH